MSRVFISTYEVDSHPCFSRYCSQYIAKYLDVMLKTSLKSKWKMKRFHKKHSIRHSSFADSFFLASIKHYDWFRSQIILGNQKYWSRRCACLFGFGIVQLVVKISWKNVPLWISYILYMIDETLGSNNKTTNVSTTFTWLSSTKFYLPNPCQSIKYFEVSYLEIPSDIAMYKV